MIDMVGPSLTCTRNQRNSLSDRPFDRIIERRMALGAPVTSCWAEEARPAPKLNDRCILTPQEGACGIQRQLLDCCRGCKRDSATNNEPPIAARFARNAPGLWLQKVSSKAAQLLRRWRRSLPIRERIGEPE